MMKPTSGPSRARTMRPTHAAASGATPPGKATSRGSKAIPPPSVHPGPIGMAAGGAVNQHKRMAMGERVSGMKKGGKVC